MRTFIALLIVSTFAYLAVSQMACVSPAPAGCASCTGIAAMPNQCTSCSSGFLLSNSISGCATACGTGCWTCTNATICVVCGPGYALYATTGVCVMLPTGCTAGTATNATTITCTAVWANYTLLTGTPVACGGTVVSTVASVSWNPVLQCVACTSTATTNKLLTTTISGMWVTCTQCANGFILLPATTQVCATPGANCGLGISTPECIPVNVAQAASTLAVGAGNQFGPTAVAVTVSGSNAGCAQALGLISGATTVLTSATCVMAASTYWCPAAAVTLATTACVTTGSITPTTLPAGCLGGLSASSTTNITCQWCTNSSFYLTTTGAVAPANNLCVANNASCVTQISAANCTVAASGFTIVGGLVVACTNLTTSCTGGVPSGSIMLASGATIVGTMVAGCQYHNASGVCVQCAMFTTSVQNCTACPSNCVNCTLSSGTTSCSTCNSGFNLWSANGSCLSACANGTNRSTNGTCAYGKNMIASVVAFASLVFYYIF